MAGLPPAVEIAALKERVAALERDVKLLRERWHEMVNKFTAPIQDELNRLNHELTERLDAALNRPLVVSGAARVEKRKFVTERDFWVSAGTVTILIAVLKFLKLL